MNFKDYLRQQKYNEAKKAEQEKSAVDYQKTASAKSDTRQNVESIINEYADKSENELMGELMREVAKGRANGTLSNGDIDNFYAQAAPLMTAEQKKKLDNIIGIIKNS